MVSAGQRAFDGSCMGTLNTESRVQGLRAGQCVGPNWLASASAAIETEFGLCRQWANGPCRGALNTESRVQGLRAGQCVGPNWLASASAQTLRPVSLVRFWAGEFR